MKDIEKLFAEKLKGHQVVPPAHTWEKLHHRLHHQRKLSYWKIAATILVFMAAVLVAYFYLKPDGSSKISVTEKVPQQEMPALARKQTPELKKDEAMAEPSTASAYGAQEKVKIPDLGKKAPTRPGKRTTVLKKAKENMLAEHRLLASVPEVEPRSIQLLEVKEKTIVSRLRLVDVTDQAASPVTITYKNAKPEEKNGSLEKTFAFLGHLKSSNISFAELRQAKDEWITRAFSSREKEEHGQ